MAIDLADDAIHALNRAAAAAAREGGEAIEPRHVLAGVISQADPKLLEILSQLDLDPATLPGPLRDVPETYEGHLPFTPAAQEVLAAAVEAASAEEPGATGSAHLLLGVDRAGGPGSSAVLCEWGLSPSALAAVLASRRASAAPAKVEPVKAASAATTLLLAAILPFACAPDPGANTSPPPADPFAATPADGPVPEIGPAPADYRPTAAGAPSTDIWIGRIERGAGGALQVRDLVNATDRDGYDNQPAFDPSGTAVYYTSAVDSTQTETFRFLLQANAAEQVTHTSAASEFSPTPIPAQDAFSAIREERGRQFLWRYGADGADLGLIFATVEPVGYHAWANGTVAVMFVLGDPPTLRVGDALSGELRTVAENPGRSIHRIPGSEDISFVRKVAEEEWWIERLDPLTGEATRLARTPTGREDYAWTPEGEILIGDGARLLAWSAEAGRWEVAHLDDGAGGDISRIAVSADGTRIALVRNRQ